MAIRPGFLRSATRLPARGPGRTHGDAGWWIQPSGLPTDSGGGRVALLL